jgi:hypothetical protein
MKIPENIIWTINKACEFQWISAEDIFKRTRKRPVVYARKIVMSILYHNSDLSNEEIGRIFKMDHASVSYSVKSLLELISFDKIFRDYYQNIEMQFVSKFGRSSKINDLLAMDVVDYNCARDILKISIARALVCH